MPSLGLGMGLHRGVSPMTLMPSNVAGNVLSLIANKANKGQVPTSATKVFSDMSKVRNTISYSNGCTQSNNNFANTIGFAGDNATLSVSGNKILATGGSAKNTVGCDPIASNSNVSGANGKVCYVRYTVKVPTATQSIQVGTFNGTSSKYLTNITAIIDSYATYSAVLIQTEAGTSTIRPAFRAVFVNSATANGKILEVQDVMIIDLTSLGLQHLSKEQCDELFPFTSTTSTTQIANDCTLNNIGSTASSGFNSEVISGKTVNFLRLDGTDDYGAFANVQSLDITTNEFALCYTCRVPIGTTGYGYIIFKGLDSGANSQYYLIHDYSNKTINVVLNGVGSTVILANNSILENIFYNFIFYKNSSGVAKIYLNKELKATGSYANALVSQPNIRLGARTANIGGTTHSGYLKGDIATQSIYQAPTLDINKIIKAETNITKIYTGVS